MQNEKTSKKKSSMHLIKHGKKENQHVEYSRFKPCRGRYSETTILLIVRK